MAGLRLWPEVSSNAVQSLLHLLLNRCDVGGAVSVELGRDGADVVRDRP
jgi:hypothetical protein